MNRDLVAANARRMLSEADVRSRDADVLKQQFDLTSDSAYLLDLLAFEILLKTILWINGVRPMKEHSYPALFASLPDAVRDRIVRVARERFPDEVGYQQPNVLLKTLERNFVNLRYP